MRVIFFLLLLANIGVAGYAWYASRQANPDASLVDQQLNADRIRITTARPMVPAVPAKAACLEWGSFGAADVKPAQAALDALQLGSRVIAHDVQVIVGFWVYIPPLDGKAEVDRKIAELRKLGVPEYYAVDAPGPMHNAISLGIFKTEEAANKYLDSLQQKGVRSARVGSRDHRVTQTAFLVRDPDVALTAKLAELRLQFPGSELKAAECTP
ncbi:MAG TPA: SPOR domain-containing protein [Burkholderiales bacterium]|nr:SPOR domain-containing protein [Burkholderiales bacterium]